jgi:hypothetical protein
MHLSRPSPDGYIETILHVRMCVGYAFRLQYIAYRRVGSSTGTLQYVDDHGANRENGGEVGYR